MNCLCVLIGLSGIKSSFVVMKDSRDTKHLYEKIAANIQAKILSGVYNRGDKLPSVRDVSKNLKVSIASVIQAYVLLEKEGLVESKFRSGFYVKDISNNLSKEPTNKKFNIAINHYYRGELVSEVNEQARIPKIIPLGAGIPFIDNLPYKELSNLTSSICGSNKIAGIAYEFPPGNEKLRKQLAKRTISWSKSYLADDFIITTGATEGLALALKAVAKPGESVIVASPTYFGILQLIETFGMQVLEIPLDSTYGLDLGILNKALKKHNVCACILSPTVDNPLGSIIPNDNKKAIYEIFSKREIPIIEDDVYSDLCFDTYRPNPIKSIDGFNHVIYVSSFSKTVAPGYRVGWMIPGKFYEKIKRLKFATSLSSPSINQIVFAEFLNKGYYEKSVKSLKKIYKNQVAEYSLLIQKYFPLGTKISQPKGGYYLWIEFPSLINSMLLQNEAIKKRISITSGPLFSTQKNLFLNNLRINCAFPISMTEESIKALGNMAKSVLLS